MVVVILATGWTVAVAATEGCSLAAIMAGDPARMKIGELGIGSRLPRRCHEHGTHAWGPNGQKHPGMSGVVSD
jgi:hypothetical protein